MAAVEIARWFLALFFVGVAAFYTVRILAMKRRRRTSPVFSWTPRTLHFATHMTFRVFWVVILGVCVARLAWPGLDRYLVTFDALWHPALLLGGCDLLAVSFAAVVVLHFYMGENWRSGTRADNGTTLVCLVAGVWAVTAHIRVEERLLRGRFRERYEA